MGLFVPEGDGYWRSHTALEGSTADATPCSESQDTIQGRSGAQWLAVLLVCVPPHMFTSDHCSHGGISGCTSERRKMREQQRAPASRGALHWPPSNHKVRVRERSFWGSTPVYVVPHTSCRWMDTWMGGRIQVPRCVSTRPAPVQVGPAWLHTCRSPASQSMPIP